MKVKRCAPQDSFALVLVDMQMNRSNDRQIGLHATTMTTTLACNLREGGLKMHGTHRHSHL